jgi:hypothetical protein
VLPARGDSSRFGACRHHCAKASWRFFRNRLALAIRVLRNNFRLKLPAYPNVQLHSVDLTDLQPAEYRADLVMVLTDDDGTPVYGVIVEVQLSENQRKPFVWPAYVVNLRARLECPVCLLVVTAEESIARVAQMVCRTLDEDRSQLYFDLIMCRLSEAAQRTLRTMKLSNYEYQSDFAKGYFAQGRAQGAAQGRSELIIRQLTWRFGPLSEDAHARILAASLSELDAIGERLLAARSLQEALGPM